MARSATAWSAITRASGSRGRAMAKTTGDGLGHFVEKGMLIDRDATQYGPVLNPADELALGKLLFQYNPGTLEFTPGVTWATIVIPGFSHRRIVYGGGAARTWAFKLQWYGDSDDEGFVKRRCDWLESLTMPEYEGRELVRGPHDVLFAFGQLVPGVRCKLMKLKIKFGPLFYPTSLLPRIAECDIELEEFTDEGLDYRE